MLNSQRRALALRAYAVVCALVAFSSLAALSARADEEISPDLIRRIELEWERLTGATGFDFELGMQPDFDSPLKAERTQETKILVDLLPGTYFYRVRGIDRIGREGKWTQVQELKVNARPPVLVAPVDHDMIRGNLPDTGLAMRWRSSGLGIRYLIEIRAEDPLNGEFRDVVVKEEVDGTEYGFFPDKPGKYQWQVSTLGDSGAEPGQPWMFEIEGVFPRELPEEGIEPTRIVRFVPPWWRGHWTLYSRYGQYRLGYSVLDQDLRLTGKFSGIAGYAMETLNWEWHDPAILGAVPWWEAELELDRQTVLTESVVMRRTYLRFGGWWERIARGFRFSPIFEGGLREISIYQPRRTNEAVRANTVRKHVGFGIAVEKKFSTSLTFGFQFKYAMESGGDGGVKIGSGLGDQFDFNARAGTLASATALEVVASTAFALSPRMQVVGRVRYEKFGGSWTPIFPIDPTSPDPSSPSNFTTTHLGFDALFAFKF